VHLVAGFTKQNIKWLPKVSGGGLSSTPYLMGMWTEARTNNHCRVQIVLRFMPKVSIPWDFTVMCAKKRFVDEILWTLYSFFSKFCKEFDGALCFWVWATWKKVIVKNKHLSINKEFSIGSGPEDVAQIGWTSLTNLCMWYRYCCSIFCSVNCKLFIIKVYLDR